MQTQPSLVTTWESAWQAYKAGYYRLQEICNQIPNKAEPSVLFNKAVAMCSSGDSLSDFLWSSYLSGNTLSHCFRWSCVWTDHIGADWSDTFLFLKILQNHSSLLSQRCVLTVVVMYKSIIHVHWNRVCLWCIRKLCLWCNQYTQHAFTNALPCATPAVNTMATK